MLPQVVDVHGSDRESAYRALFLTWAVVHDKSKHRFAACQDHGKLIYCRRKAMTLKGLHFN